MERYGGKLEENWRNMEGNRLKWSEMEPKLKWSQNCGELLEQDDDAISTGVVSATAHHTHL